MKHTKKIAAFLLAFLMIFLSFEPGLHGDFEFDDQANLLQNDDIQIDKISFHNLKLAALSGYSGPLGRPISMVTFAINHAISGFDPYYLKLTNLFIHAATTICLYLFLAQLLLATHGTRLAPLNENKFFWIALFTSVAWALHPLNITSVLYVVQRMTSLSGLFMVLALYFYALGRNKIIGGNPRGWLFVTALSPIAGISALLCKENAALLPLLTYLVELFFFKFRIGEHKEDKVLAKAFNVALWIPLITGTIYLLTHLDWLLGGYSGRSFTLVERVLTETRVIWMYIQMIIIPDISAMGIYHDDIVISTDLTSPITTLIATTALFAVLIFAITARQRAPILSFAILWFLAGHLLESSIFPLEVAHEHRNYIPMIGPLFACFYFLHTSSFLKSSVKISFMLSALLIAMLGFSTHVRAQQWGNLFQHAIVEVENHPNSPRAQQQLGRMYFKLYKAKPLPEFYEKARYHFTRSSALDQHFKAGLYARIILDFNAGFTPPQEILDEFRKRLLHSLREPGDVAMFESLLHCQFSGDCKLPDRSFMDFMEIEVERYEGDLKRQASFLSFLGSYAAQKMNDSELAGKYLKRAVDVYPDDVQGRLNYAWYFIVTEDYVSARLQLAAAKQVDSKLRKYTQRIQYMEEDIRVRMTQSQKTPIE